MFCETTRIVNEVIAKIAAKCIFAKCRAYDIIFPNSDSGVLVQLSNLTNNSDKINKNLQNICIFNLEKYFVTECIICKYTK